MIEHFDAIVIGSGFGGSVMARNLAKENMKVCVLERGNLHPPGKFARTPNEIAKAFWDPSKGLYGMYSLWSFRHFDALISSGVGGGSLIYANVLERKPPEWFTYQDDKGVKKDWPVSYQTLEEHYAAVEEVLCPVEYPTECEPYKSTPKMLALKKAATDSSLKFEKLKLAITFGNDELKPVPGEELTGEKNTADKNLHGVKRYACRLCGECYQGCNYGSKNTLDLNYLFEAKLLYHAEIRHLCEVTSFKPMTDGKYSVSYRNMVENQKIGKTSKNTNEIELTCTYLILAAGSIGSTYLLLKNEKSFPNISKKLGQQFSGNGDLLTVGIHCKDENGTPKNIDPSFGPVITCGASSGKAGHEDATKPEARFYIEDWSYTNTLIWLFDSMNLPAQILRWLKLGIAYLKTGFGLRRNKNLSADASAVFSTTDGSSNTFCMAGMGMDNADGKMFIDRASYLQIYFSRKTSKNYFNNVMKKMELVRKSVGAARLKKKPSWYLGKTITVHPLGGCPMGATADEGVVDSSGEVHGYKNFFIADGSVLPAAVGPNPSLTIAAVASLFSKTITKRHNPSKSDNEDD